MNETKNETISTPRFGAAYLRVSTDEQAELSPESQLEEIRKYAGRENIILLEECIFIDSGISGKKAEKRPRFMDMIAAAKEKNCPFSVILLWKYSRFARNQEESIFYKSILRSKCGVEVISVTEPLIAGPFGSLIERIIEWMDEFYSIRLSQEVKRSMLVNAKKGKLQCSASFGYSIKDGVLVPNEAESKHVQYIFDSFLSGKGIYVIARELNSLGVRTHRGNRFESRTIEYILRNPVYIGKLRWNPTGKTRRDFLNDSIIVSDSGHTPLVSADVWEAAQKRLDEIKNQYGRKARPTYGLKGWTSGIVRCASCGATLIFVKPHYYKCNNFVKGKCRHSQHIRADALEAAITSRLKHDAANASALTFDMIPAGPGPADELIRLKSTLRVLKSKIERLQDAYLAGVIELENFSLSKDKIEPDIRQTQLNIERLLTKYKEEKSMFPLQDAISSAAKTLESKTASTEEKNTAARSVIENCTYDKAASLLSVTYRLTL